MPYSLRSAGLVLQGVLACAALLTLPACRRHHGGDDKPKPVKKAAESKRDTSGDAALLKKIEAFTGARTKIVWLESQNPKQPDPFSYYDDQILKGLDTRDPRGEHVLLSELGNYTRPVLSPDGNTILFTQKTIREKGGRNVFDLTIYRTDWNGTKPVKVADGIATTIFRDPATGRDWVYAGRKPREAKHMSFDTKTLVRFPLDDPDKSEVVWDQTLISPDDNIQLSRDGLRACAMLPWPKACVLHLEGKEPDFEKFGHGCWPSHSPDNSHVAWIFDGSHKSATFFAEDQSRTWDVRFNDAPQFRGAEVYHPRWTNHPRFLILTGPYIARRGGIRGGARGAQVNLGRFSPTLDRVEEWLPITDNNLGCGWPDAWVENAGGVQLAGFGQPPEKRSPASAAQTAWPANPAGLAFLWSERSSMNSFRSSDGRLHPAQMDASGAARAGRFDDLLLDGGTSRPSGDSESFALAALRDKPDVAFEALVIPPAADSEEARTMFTMPGLALAMNGSKLVVNGKSEAKDLPARPFHLAVSVTGRLTPAAQITVFVDGKPVPVNPSSATAAPETGITFGGGWRGGLMRIAVYHRALTPGEAATAAAQALAVAARFTPAPPQVKLLAKLVSVSPVPALEDIEPYTATLVACVYEVQRVISGDFKEPRVLVKHWGLLNSKPTTAFPRAIGKTYEITIEPEATHPELKGERVSDETDVFDLQPWLDVATPQFAK